MDRPEHLLQQLKIDRRHSPVRKRRWPWVLTVFAALAAVLLTLGAMRPLEVETAPARRAADAGPVSVLDASGYVTARRLATVSSKITGKVREVLIEEGQQVASGEVLAYLDDSDARAQYALSQAELEAARAQLGEVRANLDLAELTVIRQQALVKDRLTSQSALDQALAERDALRARLLSAQRQIAVSQDALAVAAIGVDNTVIRAPFAGVVVAKAAQPGEMISPISAGGGFTRTGIGTLVDMDSLEVQVDVNEAYIGRVQPEQPVASVLNAYPDWRIPGNVIAIIPTADRSKATVKVRIALNSRDRRIVPDMGVRVSFLDAGGAATPAGVWVPSRAVLGEGSAAAVMVVAAGRARRVAVRLGESHDSDRLVLDGLKGGEAVVLSPPPALDDGDRVRVLAH